MFRSIKVPMYGCSKFALTPIVPIYVFIDWAQIVLIRDICARSQRLFDRYENWLRQWLDGTGQVLPTWSTCRESVAVFPLFHQLEVIRHILSLKILAMKQVLCKPSPQRQAPDTHQCRQGINEDLRELHHPSIEKYHLICTTLCLIAMESVPRS